MMKTFSPKPADIQNDWVLIDADGQTLGRLSTRIATILMGKHKPGFSAHVDGGDNVIVINAAKLVVTGKKMEDKKYYRHSGYPGGIKETTLGKKMETDPAWVIQHAVRGMLPKNRLTDDRLNRLKVYASSEHPHEAQKPKTLGDK